MLLLQNNLMIAVVDKGQAARFVAIAKEAGAGGGTIIPAKGTASGKVMRFMGFGGKSREMILMVIDGSLAHKIVDRVRSEGRMQGVAAIMGSDKEENMASKWKMITIIVNTGYADDIMDAARKAGASGGTITHARGTGTAEDAKFFGVTIVPEKEMITILCEAERTQKLVNAITSLKCLEEPGIGILYTQDVTEFRNLDPGK
jgi:nitrogen regulatory protein PII